MLLPEAVADRRSPSVGSAAALVIRRSEQPAGGRSQTPAPETYFR